VTASAFTRGFTGEEELSVGSLVHLNGRVYDALLARFTSADPTVTDPMNMQGWNRYSYVGNDAAGVHRSEWLLLAVELLPERHQLLPQQLDCKGNLAD